MTMEDVLIGVRVQIVPVELVWVQREREWVSAVFDNWGWLAGVLCLLKVLHTHSGWELLIRNNTADHRERTTGVALVFFVWDELMGELDDLGLMFGGLRSLRKLPRSIRKDSIILRRDIRSRRGEFRHLRDFRHLRLGGNSDFSFGIGIGIGVSFRFSLSSSSSSVFFFSLLFTPVEPLSGKRDAATCLSQFGINETRSETAGGVHPGIYSVFLQLPSEPSREFSTAPVSRAPGSKAKVLTEAHVSLLESVVSDAESRVHAVSDVVEEDAAVQALPCFNAELFHGGRDVVREDGDVAKVFAVDAVGHQFYLAIASVLLPRTKLVDYIGKILPGPVSLVRAVGGLIEGVVDFPAVLTGRCSWCLC